MTSITYQHDGNLLPRWQQLESQAISDGDQTMLIVSVQTMTFLV